MFDTTASTYSRKIIGGARPDSIWRSDEFCPVQGTLNSEMARQHFPPDSPNLRHHILSSVGLTRVVHLFKLHVDMDQNVHVP